MTHNSHKCGDDDATFDGKELVIPDLLKVAEPDGIPSDGDWKAVERPGFMGELDSFHDKIKGKGSFTLTIPLAWSGLHPDVTYDIMNVAPGVVEWIRYFFLACLYVFGLSVWLKIIMGAF